MFIIKDDSTMMAVTKGDSAYFTITLTGDIPEDGTQALFTVKEKRTQRTLIRKDLAVYGGVISIELGSQDTNKLEPSDPLRNIEYIWDIRVLFSETEVVTPMVPGVFYVLEAVGDV